MLAAARRSVKRSAFDPPVPEAEDEVETEQGEPDERVSDESRSVHL